MQFKNRGTTAHQEVLGELKIYKSDLSKDLKKMEDKKRGATSIQHCALSHKQSKILPL